MNGWAVLPLLLLLTTGCVTTIDRDVQPVSTVSRTEVQRAAEHVKRQESGRSTGAGVGESMAPLYGENTILVIHPIAFEELEKDMIVAYRSSDGRRIVHRIQFKQGNKWIARGINNAESDLEPVTEQNLIGVVYGVFSTAEPIQDKE